MNGNICPKCGKEVMQYSRFIRKAEPYKIFACGSCGAKLRRSRYVYLYLLIMFAIMSLVTIPFFKIMVTAQISYWIIWPAAILCVACWVLLINYLAWRIIGWISVESQ